MNSYPGQGLGSGTAILGSMLGQVYTKAALPTLCKIYGYLTEVDGTPVGHASSVLGNSNAGITTVPVWQGVQLTAYISTAVISDGKIVIVDKLSTTNNELGYFEFNVIQGLTVVISCPSFGKSISVITTGHTSIDISTLF